jgi:hypothetical protein
MRWVGEYFPSKKVLLGESVSQSVGSVGRSVPPYISLAFITTSTLRMKKQM